MQESDLLACLVSSVWLYSVPLYSSSGKRVSCRCSCWLHAIRWRWVMQWWVHQHWFRLGMREPRKVSLWSPVCPLDNRVCYSCYSCYVIPSPLYVCMYATIVELTIVKTLSMISAPSCSKPMCRLFDIWTTWPVSIFSLSRQYKDLVWAVGWLRVSYLATF